MIRVLIVNDWPLFSTGIRTTLESMGDCVIVGESTDIVEIVEMAHAHHPDVVLLDGGLTTVDALEMARQLHQHASYIGGMFIFAPSQDEEYLFQFVKLGAVAYEKRTISPEELVDKVRRVSKGEYLISSSPLVPTPSNNHKPLRMRDDWQINEDEPVSATSASPLSSREVEILAHIAKGNSNKEIAKALKISDQTVKNHITSILKKLEVNDRTAAVVYALRERWIKLDEVASS